MPVYIRKGSAKIPEPSEEEESDEEEEKSYLMDPDQMRDRLPQPFRTIDKVLDRVLDRAWELIVRRDTVRRAAEQAKKSASVLEIPGEATDNSGLPRRTNCLTCTDDGKYVLLGHLGGLSVICTSSHGCIAAWVDRSLELTFIHSTSLGVTAYLIATVDDMGIARLFAFYPNCLCLIKLINETDNINQRNICTKFEICKGGDYGAVLIECSGTSWLEIYRFPRESWLRELEVLQASSLKKVSNISGITDKMDSGIGVKFSLIGMVLKVKQPRALSGTSLKSPFEVLQKTGNGTVIGSGQNHMIGVKQWEEQNAVLKYVGTSTCDVKIPEERPSQCTFHFLLPGVLSPLTGGKIPPAGVPVAVCLWWSGNHNLFQYVLHKTLKFRLRPDNEPKADVVWPNAQQIVCSAISKSTKYIALGLADGLVTIWDRHLGLPWSVLAVSSNSDFSRMLFIDDMHVCTEDSTLHPKIHVLVTCRSGACHLITAGRGVDSHVTKLRERPVDSESFPSALLPVLQKMFCSAIISCPCNAVEPSVYVGPCAPESVCSR
ncbi:WD repeat-containing protein 93 isoform X2 [Scleropages formosus]|uniref:WD repeat-containing protein 93 isoform X2 n=1 Tax=Scleropages formosus TaxID=113540 RepID=UPI000878F4C4|nr:WD repeat-containing protein 93 isoform X2 [Scleropages formosus]